MRITTLIKKYQGRFSFNLLLIVLEGALALLFPLFIGHAIEDALHQDYQGALRLGLLGLAALLVGVGRRVFDSRFYAKVYQEMGAKVIANQGPDDTSKKTARLGMMKELVEFLEFSFPELIHATISLVGVVVIIATLQIQVFWGALFTAVLVLPIYWLSSKKTLRFNKEANDEQERQVAVIAMADKTALQRHLKKMMRWNVKLSDLEALNFSLSWSILMAFLVAAIVISVGSGLVHYGALFSLIMYVFQYLESLISLPFFYQNGLRLREITNRLSNAEPA
ncbi:MAG TPA: hypothetical protein DCR93_13410 [Cytophagales bacterium]|nr:hypothetical protein [Cytophagales bacterium]HAP60439.1 hypothetical protein [Cytophagales bacterium]